MTRREDIRTLRVDQVGSLLRPRALIDDFLAHGRGSLPRDALDRRIDDAIQAVVAKQEAIGLPIVTDGEFARISWQVSFATVRGWPLDTMSWRNFVANPDMRAADERPNTRGRDAVESFKTPATERLRLADNFPLAEYRRLAAIATVPAKAMIMGPDRVAQMCDIVASRPHYESAEAFLADVVSIQSDMIHGLVEAGCPYVQLDEPSYTGYVDRATLERMRARGEDPLANLRRAIAASNGAIAAHRDRAVFGIHVCRGNRASMWHREGTYDGIAEELFGSLRFDRLLLEYDTARAGGFEPLRFVPRGGPIVVLGLVTTKTGAVETVESLLRRIDDAQRFVPLDQLAISPQCGFASGMAGNDLSEDQQWRKLEVLREAARRVWG
jgi:5-methyltetrahydropteroyltriglutamate--homocysteine methyltransferase